LDNEDVRTVTPFLILITFMPYRAQGATCIGPTAFCERLTPGLLTFIGKPVSESKDRHKRSLVTFEILEQFTGPRSMGPAKVSFEQGYPKTNEPLFVAAVPNGDVALVGGGCGVGMVLPINEPWVKQFREDARLQRPARVPVIVHSTTGFVPISGAAISLKNSRFSFAGETRGADPAQLRMVPSGDY